MSHPSIEFTLVADAEVDAPAIGAEGYARMLKLLLPPGKLWRLDPDSNISKLLLANGDELARVDARGVDLIRESLAATAVELLPDWEAALLLPSTGTDAERQARVVALLTRRPRYRPVDFQAALAPFLGLDPEDVIIIEQSRADALALGDEREIFRFYVLRDTGLPGSYDIAAAQAIVDQMKPSHTVGHVILSLDFLCDDPDSLCDVGVLGV